MDKELKAVFAILGVLLLVGIIVYALLPKMQVTPIKDILDNPSKYAGKTVMLNGTTYLVSTAMNKYSNHEVIGIKDKTGELPIYGVSSAYQPSVRSDELPIVIYGVIKNVCTDYIVNETSQNFICTQTSIGIDTNSAPI